MPVSVLLTRPEKDAEDTAKLLTSCGYTAIISPLSDINILPNTSIPQADIYVFTSKYGVNAFADLSDIKSKCVYAVGEKTADLLQKIGFKDIQTASGSGLDLLTLIRNTASKTDKILHISGDQLAVDISTELKSLGFQAERLVVYTTEYKTTFPNSLREELACLSEIFVFIYSSKSLSVFETAFKKQKLALHPRLVCISPELAQEALHTFDTVAAKRPCTESMIEALDQFYSRCKTGT